MPDGSSKSKSSLHFAAGLATGVLSGSLLQPADLLKTRIQQSPHSTLVSTIRSISRGPNVVRELWRGTLPSIIRTGLGSALYFTSLNALRRSSLLLPTSPISKAPSAKYSNTTNLLSGALARTMAGFVLMPVTVLKVRYESSLYAYDGLLGAAKSILRTEGFRGFFSGFGATAARDAPYAGLYVLFYEQTRSKLGTFFGGGAGRELLETGSKTQTTSVNFASGAIAAITATAITNPFDAIKTRLQLKPKEYGNMGRAAIRMVREEGIRSLFDGLGLRVARKAMSSAIAWSLYEELVRNGQGVWIWKTEGTV